MLRFLHGYLPRQWDGLIKHGMIDDTSGVKFHQCFNTPQTDRFNVLASNGGRLFEIVRECSRPFYIDRLQGGWWIDLYPYDEALLRRYQELSGEWMLGMQMHEWASNMKNDWGRIADGLADGQTNPDEAAIIQATVMSTHTPGEMRSFLESATAAEYAAWKQPQSVEEAMAQYSELFTRRQKQFWGLLLPADSYFMAVRHELAGGAKALMPEIGGQIVLERWQIALTRGMAKASGIPWGTYYEPWGGVPFGCCYYKTDFINEWGVIHRKSGLFGGGFAPNSGSSRALQKRIYFHSLLSGAQFMSEEWGTSNTFYDWNDYALTPYGNIKKEFLAFAAGNRNLGQVHAPVALVIPSSFEIFDLTYLVNDDERYLGYQLTDAGRRRQFAHIRAALTPLLGDSEQQLGNEGHVIGNSAFPDCFDIVYEDVGADALTGYEVIVDLDVFGTLPAKYPGLADRILDSTDIGAMQHRLTTMLHTMLPCYVTGNVSWIINHTDTDGWVIGLFNNEGVYRSAEKGDEILPNAAQTVCIETKGAQLAVLHGEEKNLHKNGDDWQYTVPAGEVVLLSFHASV